jgi:AGZA family xanthine/uracil permease-like MFS transporter
VQLWVSVSLTLGNDQARLRDKRVREFIDWRYRAFCRRKFPQDGETGLGDSAEGRLIDRYFKLAENQTSVKQELLGGLTTFVTMAYIVVVNPQILAQAGMPADGVVFATCLSAAVATLVMGLYANYPIALAPGMSLNAYFTYSVCLAMHVPWRTALAVVFFSGVLFLVLTVTRVREQIVNGMPDCLKHSTAAGIGMFIAFVGLRTRGGQFRDVCWSGQLR